MIDNWTLQDVESVLSQGIDTRTAGDITLSPDRQHHRFSPVLAGVLQIDALMTLLSHVVFFDSLTVDSKFVSAWRRDDGHLLPLANFAIVKEISYSELGEEMIGLREKIVDELCVTPTLEQAMKVNREEWNSGKEISDRHLSAVIWGGAGMLARSHLTEVPYFGHPSRRRLIEETRLFSRTSAGEVVTRFIETERANMFRFRSQQISGSVAHISLPPLAVKAIENSDNVAQLIPAALNLRDQHRELREWISSYQQAIDLDNERGQLRYEKALRGVAQSIKVKYGAEKDESTGLSLSTSYFKVDLRRSVLDRIRNTFGVRSTLCKLVTAPRGQRAVHKLVSMLGEGRSLLGRDILKELQRRYSGQQR